MQHKKLPQQNRIKYIGVRVKGMIFNATFRNISVMSWRLALLVEETGVPGKKPSTYRTSMTNCITYCCIEYTSPGVRTHNVSDENI
jgi:hypothetical protein